MEKRATEAPGAGRRFQAIPAVIATARIAVTTTGIARRHQGPRSAPTSRTVAPCGSGRIDSISTRTSATACQRFRASFTRHRRINSGILGCRFGGSSARSGSRANTDAITSVSVSPRNGGRPLSIS